MADVIEMPLPNGKSMLCRIESERVYDVFSYEVKKRTFSAKWPFARTVKEPRVSCRYQTIAGRFNDSDSRYVFKCTLAEFATAVGIGYTSFSETKIRATVSGQD